MRNRGCGSSETARPGYVPLRVASRCHRGFGLGVELAVPSAVIASTSGNGFRASGRQEERVLLGLLYLLHRGEHLTQLPVLVPWQYEWESSTRVAIGVTGRLVW